MYVFIYYRTCVHACVRALLLLVFAMASSGFSHLQEVALACNCLQTSGLHGLAELAGRNLHRQFGIANNVKAVIVQVFTTDNLLSGLFGLSGCVSRSVF